MYMENKKNIVIVILGLLGVIIVSVVSFIVFRSGKDADLVTGDQETSTADPIDVVLDFYNPWLAATKATSTNPYASGLAASKILGEALRSRLISSEGDLDTDIDPVLCQTTTPERVTGRIVSRQENEVRVLVMPKEKELTAQSVFTLKRHNEGWFIDSIMCSPGEFALPREFSFETEGYLLKSVPPPLDPQYWYVVFEDNGEPGHAVPLLFSMTSKCISIEKEEQVCIPDQFGEAAKVSVFGQMTEAGAEVTRLEFVQE
jgi:hypothetical protein